MQLQFSVRPIITGSQSLASFFANWQVGEEDLIVTNEYVLAPALGGAPCPCDTLYQEQYGKGEPSDVMVDAMFAAIAGKRYKRIIAIGGGTVIDIAKLFVFGDGRSCEEIFEKGAELPRKRSLIIIPTTCGTGSEVTGISIVELTRLHTKKGLAVPALYADEAVLIPAMLATLPWEVFATSSIDALIHAVESYASPKANPFTRALGGEAIRLILAGYQKIAASGKRELPGPGEMEKFLIASTGAGIAFANAGCAAVHALSYPIGAGWHVPHGKANYLVFGAVFAAYKKKNAPLAELESLLATALGCPPAQVWDALFGLLAKVYDNQRLSALGADAAKCAEMAVSVVQNQQRLLVNNPVALSEDEIKDIYLACL